MELRTEALEKLMSKEEESNRLCEERAKELQEFLIHNRKLKEKWRDTVAEITSELQVEIEQLKNKNQKLEHENLRLRMSGDKS